MFYYLKGTVSEIGQNSLIVDVNGIGFLINTSLKTISSVAQGQQTKLFIAESIGESNFDLYGFSEQQEKRFFELLISVSGVGPKAAISLLSSMNTDMLVMAIINDDSKALTSAPGIGKKIAQRIILELRDKLGAEVPSFASWQCSLRRNGCFVCPGIQHCGGFSHSSKRRLDRDECRTDYPRCFKKHGIRLDGNSV